MLSISTALFYYTEDEMEESLRLFLLGIYAIPFVFFLYIAIGTGLISNADPSGKCFLGSKIWLITDCIVFGSMFPAFINAVYEQHKKEIDREEVEEKKNYTFKL